MTTGARLPPSGGPLRSATMEHSSSHHHRRRGATLASSSRVRPSHRSAETESSPFVATILSAAIGALVATLVLILFGSLAPGASPWRDSDEAIARVYRQALPGVVSVVDRGQPGVEAPGFVVGSGFVVDLDGHVLTNHHVIENVRDLGTVLSDGSAYRADLVGEDPVHDLALLKVEVLREQLHPLRLGDSSALRVGQRVIAVGSPYGLDRTLTTGVVSYLGRRVEVSGALAVEDVIQTDAALNPGNSGGPLLDKKGEVIGVNTRAMLKNTGDHEQGSTGVGFAIPSSVVRRLLAEMISGQLRTRPWLGITVRDSEGGVEAEGAKVVLVVPGSPASEVQMEGARSLEVRPDGTLGESGDVITAIDGVSVRSVDDLASYLSCSGAQVGDVARLQVVRAGEALEVSVRLRARDDKQADLSGAL